MDDLSAQRTLVKSPPELWAEISDLDSLARHLDQFGEIRITQLDPEKTVAWEGDRIRGTVHLEQSGWGTKVTLAAELVAVDTNVDAEQVREPEAEPAAPVLIEDEDEDERPEPESVLEAVQEPVIEAERESVVEAKPVKRPGFFARLFGRRTDDVVVVAEPAIEPTSAPEPEPVAPAPELEAEPAIELDVEAEPVLEAESEPEPEPEPEPGLDGERAQAILVGVLDDLGSAHHRPFSRG